MLMLLEQEKLQTVPPSAAHTRFIMVKFKKNGKFICIPWSKVYILKVYCPINWHLWYSWQQILYCQNLYSSVLKAHTRPLQRVLNAVACLVTKLGPRDHVTPALYELHWLPIHSWIQFKLCLLIHHAIGGRSQPYISELVTSVAAMPRLTALSGERRTRRSENKTCLLLERFQCSRTEGLEQASSEH